MPANPAISASVWDAGLLCLQVHRLLPSSLTVGHNIGLNERQILRL